MKKRASEGTAGLLYGLAAYGFWGILPLYFRALQHVSPWELVGQRIVWCALLLAGVMTLMRGWGRLARCLRDRRTRRTLLLTSVLIGINWFLFIYAASTKQLTLASLGYFIAPLVNTALGVFALGERMRRAQVAAIVLAATGVIALTVLQGELPWLALGLAFSFSVYGLFRKTVAADALTGLAVESFVLSPLALGYVIWLHMRGAPSFGHVDHTTDILLAAGGVVTVIPLYCFAQAARRLRLTTIGFLQFLSPTVQLLLAVLLLGEPFDWKKLAGFVPIWLALAVYVGDAITHVRRLRSGLAAVPLAE